jgi:hypothetical protein
MFKEQAGRYLFKCADSNSKTHDINHFLQSPTSFADNDFSFNNTTDCETKVLFDLIEHLKKHHDRFLSKQTLFNFHKTENFDIFTSYYFTL